MIIFKKKKIIIYLIISLLIFISLSTFLFIDITTNEVDNYYEFSIQFNTFNDTGYQLILPVILNSNNQLHPFMNNIINNNSNITTDYIDTEHGIGIQINGTGNVTLINKGHYKGTSNVLRPEEDIDPFIKISFKLSLKKEDLRGIKESYWFYYTSDNQSAFLMFSAISNKILGGENYLYEGKIQGNGWQEIVLEHYEEKV